MNIESFTDACAGFTIVIIVLSIFGMTFIPMDVISTFVGSCVGVLLYSIFTKKGE